MRPVRRAQTRRFAANQGIAAQAFCDEVEGTFLSEPYIITDVPQIPYAGSSGQPGVYIVQWMEEVTE